MKSNGPEPGFRLAAANLSGIPLQDQRTFQFAEQGTGFVFAGFIG
jgi:hypothetical protein